MTSNLGARFLDKRSPMGFSAHTGAGLPTKVEDQVMAEVKKAFNPEFLKSALILSLSLIGAMDIPETRKYWFDNGV